MYMKQYDDNGQLKAVLCNGCGRRIAHSGNIITSGALSFRADWGYFSNKDGEQHSFDLCEHCYDRIVETFKIPVEIEERTELV